MSEPTDGTPKTVLLTVSGSIPSDLQQEVAAGRRPRADYVVLADAFGADVVDVDAALASTGFLGRALARLGPGPLLAWYCFRHRRSYEVIVSDGEQVGLPFAMLVRVFGRGGSRHVMIVHVISTKIKRRVMRFGALSSLIDRYVVYCTRQAELLREWFDVPCERIALTPFMVDTEFFDPGRVEVAPRRMICAAGLERRDYATLLDAVRGLDVEVVIAAASPWSTRADSTAGRDLPDNVTVCRLDLSELRELYAASSFVVMPLDDVDFQAGITTILEAMSMARPVIVTRTPGQTDTVVGGVTGEYIDVGDSEGLARTIEAMLSDSDRRDAQGAAARAWAVEHAELDVYAGRLAGLVDRVAAV